MGFAGAGAAAGAAAGAQAIKASGAIVSIEPNDFEAIINRAEAPLVVYATSRFFSTKYLYLTSYKGLVFLTKSGIPLSLKPTVEIVERSNMASIC